MKLVTVGVDRAKYNVCTTPRNEYGDKVVAHEIYDPETGRIYYRCDHEHWGIDFPRWQKSYGDDPEGPEPMSDGHCMFLTPMGYGKLPVGETRLALVRRCIRHSVVAVLHGWDRELRQTPAGMRQLARIVKATVAARMAGTNLGGAPFLACVMGV
jgi:hypothetical protein